MPDLFSQPIHLGSGGTAIVQPEFTGMDWYADYVARTLADGNDGRLVSLYTFTEDWTSWECHPSGHEVVVCTAGRMVLHQEWADGSMVKISIGPGEYAINAPGVWHTADVEGTATALFITSGLGTTHRPR